MPEPIHVSLSITLVCSHMLRNMPLLMCRRRHRGDDFARTPGREPDRHALQCDDDAHRATLRRAAGCAMWGCWLCAAVWGGRLPAVAFGKAAMHDGRAGMVQWKGGEGGAGDARFELGPTPRTPLRPPTTAHTLGSRPTPRMTHDEPAPGIDRGTGECAPCSGAVHGVNATRVVSYTCSPLRARV